MTTKEFPRTPRKEDFENKTIKSVDLSCMNVMMFYFADGSSVAIEAVRGSYGIYMFECFDPKNYKPVVSKE